ncbi:hypothetical protein KL864_25505 [Mycolicibacterium goodii]|uniref:hypothetical protein n=1 Tax=Mycolicibacterium goodii TaxID=134601 RepID=UPI001BDBDD95|nr:hypothetical protein [Mycolicibacterium goodii]MBU8819255.1 hypothetical protein [Mycolicibacterium goodii]
MSEMMWTVCGYPPQVLAVAVGVAGAAGGLIYGAFRRRLRRAVRGILASLAAAITFGGLSSGGVAVLPSEGWHIGGIPSVVIEREPR